MSYKRPLDSDSMDPSKKSRPPPSRCLHCRNVPYEVPIEELIACFARFGEVKNAVILPGKPQALVEFVHIESAEAALQQSLMIPLLIRGRQIYVNYSNHESLQTPSQKAGQPGDQSITAANSILLAKVLNAVYPITVDVLHQVFSPFGNVQKIVIFQKGDLSALIQFDNVQSALAAKSSLDGREIYAGCCTLNITFSKLPAIKVSENSPLARDFTQEFDPHAAAAANPYMAQPLVAQHPPMPANHAPFPHAMPFGGGMPQGPSPFDNAGCVLLVTGLVEGLTPDDLFKLFNFYGNVQRIKILYNRKDNALIQYASTQSAGYAMANLNDVTIRGKKIRVLMSKHQSIALPREPDQGSDLTRDYSESRRHRYKMMTAKTVTNLCPPSQALHLSNIPDHITEEDIRVRFSEVGFVKGVKFLPVTPKKMALVLYESPEIAINGLMRFHESDMGGSNLRVSFTRSRYDGSS
eukprot:TRINITY_DN1633_c0_g1_i1.p1 TRINITY_DN1633_c0_g1~~TRINITY_DN1633_c0_g1_i1.p1  ORF type:complete len:466 (+),score=77.46 TRINITY_DN1633_c0_g1_i1:56-1453(+)